jgi:hypothetical protein
MLVNFDASNYLAFLQANTFPTGGSVSIPSAFNGIYSIKPSHGRISFKDAANSVCDCEAHGFTCNEADWR